MTKSKILEKAKEFLWTTEEPTNDVVFNTDYYGHSVNGSSYPWNMTFIWDIFRMCNAEELITKTSYTPNLEKWATEKNLIVEKPEQGDLVVTNENIIGIVSEKDFDSITIIAGDITLTDMDDVGMVIERQIPITDIKTIIRPKYEKEKATTKRNNKKSKENK